MEIQCIHEELSIIKRVYNDEFYEINLCKHKEVNENKLYTVITIKDENLVRENIEIFSSLRYNNKFTDFIECFSKNSYLYIVFSYYEEKPLDFNEVCDFPLMQRVEIVKQILSMCIILNMPAPILYDAVSNINLDSSGKIYFNYFLRRINKYNNLKNKDVIKKLSIIFINIFSGELEINSVSGLKELIEKCENMEYENIMEIYRDYISLYDNFLQSLNIKREKELNWFRKILNKIIEVFNKVKLPLIMLVLCIGVIYLIVTLTYKPKTENPTKIKSIGTVQITE